MGLVFTNEQVRELTGQILAAPAKIAKLIDEKNKSITQKGELKELDDLNAVYTNNIVNIITKYHDELKYLTGDQRTTYDPINIDTTAKTVSGSIHRPSTWTKFQPQVHDSNNGNPVSSWSDTDPSKSSAITSALMMLTTGFSDGSFSTTTTSSFVGDEIETTTSSFSVNNKALLS